MEEQVISFFSCFHWEENDFGHWDITFKVACQLCISQLSSSKLRNHLIFLYQFYFECLVFLLLETNLIPISMKGMIFGFYRMAFMPLFYIECLVYYNTLLAISMPLFNFLLSFFISFQIQINKLGLLKLWIYSNHTAKAGIYTVLFKHVNYVHY